MDDKEGIELIKHLIKGRIDNIEKRIDALMGN